MEIKRTIIATSGGFSIEPRNKRMDRYILSQVNAQRPKICFIPTASGDSKNYIKRFYNFFEKENCDGSHLSLFKGNIVDFEAHLLHQDIIYVGGGNTKNMLAIWKDWGIDEILKQAYNQGTLLCGISAGSLCWFEQGLTDSIPGKLTALDGLGLIKGSNCPFLNGSENKKERYLELIEQRTLKPGIATEIGVAVHYENEQLISVIASRKYAKAYRYFFQGRKIAGEILHPEYI